MWHRKKEEHGRILREGKPGKTHIFGEGQLLQDDQKKTVNNKEQNEV
jgi:hypothetical protein